MIAKNHTPINQLKAPEHWACVDIISDLHLNVYELPTFVGWENYLRHSRCDAIFILGDLFDVWIGDDCIDAEGSFEHRCVDILRNTAHQKSLFLMPGNRDFLIGRDFYDYCNIQALSDPTVLIMGVHRWLLSHGDALCLADIAYQGFRSTVRDPSWQKHFLEQPLEMRREQARSIRAASESRKKHEQTYVDIDIHEAQIWMDTCDATALIHGHTHQPADHLLPNGLVRHVLSDWDLAADPPRAQILRLSKMGAQRIDLTHST